MVPSMLLVVIDPTTEQQPALKRGEQLAVDCGARLHLFCCDYQEDISQFASRKDAKHHTLCQSRERLEQLARPLREEGLSVTTEAYWNHNWEQSVIHACARIGADMVIKTSFPHSRLERQLTHTSDYSLLRHAPCATLLIHDQSPWLQQRILAAVTIDTGDVEHDLLNNAIITEAQRLALATRSELHLVAALDATADMADILGLMQDEEEKTDDEDLLSQRFGVDRDRIHIHQGSAKDVIVDVANNLNIDALVMGTVARKGLQAALLGNTAEKVLDAVDMDVLTVN
ncbi:universal stress protein [Pseudomaricurvus alkylphenolicus]|jgi:universal stress protein E|uniref:universal stress protein n=1 Tax=Pseudomaricurvus alkylphenolicus TaxID=1306991 RepID=UPI0014241DC5|nr:universal stress protein [Pseudomaricurvus alkylphenolicus]NIB39564.1 universal stress protein [Pseudomaricurvus alkylphenolicus]